MLSKLRRAYGALLRSEAHLQSLAEAELRLRDIAAAAARAERQIRFLADVEARRDLAELLADPRYADPLRLERSGFKVHSQYDEDGVISEIFRRIGETSRSFVEFGVGDGGENCTGFLLLQGWRGLWIEGNADHLRNIQRMWATEIAAGQLTARHAFITVDTIDGLIDEAGFKGEIDLLTVDIDGNDYHVLERISVVSPRVICVEYNANFPPHVAWAMPRDDQYVWCGLDYRYGASLKALETLLAGRGYSLVGCSLAGVNAFFVRSDLAKGKFAEPFTAENHYNAWRLSYANGVLWRGVRS